MIDRKSKEEEEGDSEAKRKRKKEGGKGGREWTVEEEGEREVLREEVEGSEAIRRRELKKERRIGDIIKGWI